MQSTDTWTPDTAAQAGRSFISQQLDLRSTQIGSSASSTAADLRRIAGELEKSETISSGAELATRGADVIDRVGSYLQEADGEQLIGDIEAFTRERPWVVAAAALAAGFAASRMLKVSAARRLHAADVTTRTRRAPAGATFADGD